MSSDIGKWILALAIGVALIALGWKVPYILVTLHVLLCLLLIVVVLLQSGKAADLAGAFGGAGSQTAFGPRGAATFLTKTTTWCAIMFMLTSISISLRQTPEMSGGGSLLERTTQQQKSEPVKAPETAPAKQPAPPTQPQPQPSQSPGQQVPPAQPAKK